VLLDRGLIDRVRSTEPGPTASRQPDDGGAPVVRVDGSLDEPPGFHALHQAAQAGLAVPHAHERVELADSQPARATMEVGERGIGARVDSGFAFEIGDDVAQHRLVHVDQCAPESSGLAEVGTNSHRSGPGIIEHQLELTGHALSDRPGDGRRELGGGKDTIVATHAVEAELEPDAQRRRIGFQQQEVGAVGSQDATDLVDGIGDALPIHVQPTRRATALCI